MNDVLSSAIEFASRGWSVIPIPRKKKEAKIKWSKYQCDRATTGDIGRWFAKPRNVAIVCGDVSGGLVVRDFDDSKSYRKWSSDHPELATRLPTVATARGFHVYARMDPCPRTRDLGDGELRGNGSYVLAPPSIHPSGAEYHWVVPFEENSVLPIVSPSDFNFTEEDRSRTEEIQKRTEEDRGLQKKTEAINQTADVERRYELAIDASLPSREGQRHKCLFNLARRILAIHRDGLPRIETRKRLFDAWWAKSLPIIQTKDKATSLLDFLTAMGRVKTPLDDIVPECVIRAKANPRPDWSIEYGERVAILAGLCRELQRVHGSETFFVACRKAGAAIGVSHTVAAQYLKLFVEIQKLTVIEPGKPGGTKATRYRYIANDL